MTTTCFVSYEIHPTTMGGCGVLIHHAADVLLAAGHEVVLLLDIPPDIFSQFNDRDRLTFANPARLRAFRVDDLCADFPWTPAQITDPFQWKSLRFAHALAHLSRQHAFDFVEFFEYCGPGYYALSRRLFRPDPARVMGCRLHGSIEVLERFGQGLARDRQQLSQFAFEHASLSLAETVLVPTATYYEEYFRKLYRLEPCCTVVSSPPKQPFKHREITPSRSGHFSITFIGRLFHIKGVDQLVHACVALMKERPDLDFSVDLVGYDSPDTPFPAAGPAYSHYLLTLIPERLRSRFRFRGQMSHQAIATLLADSLFAVFPNRIESFCYALHEVYDAGVPVIINSIPAFADFFVHEQNCLAYSGRTCELITCMRRLIDDEALRSRISRPYPVADHPVGDFYASPHARRPLTQASGHVPRTQVFILCDSPQGIASSPASRSLAAQTLAPHQCFWLIPAPQDGEETLWWLGSPWHLRDSTGRPVEPSDVTTLEAFVLLHESDALDPAWFELCAGAMQRRPASAFTGTWSRCQGAPIPSTLDLAPELAPFDHPARLHRILLRTQPDQLLCDLFDTTLGPLGHLGAVWSGCATIGQGVLLPECLVDSPRPDLLAPESRHLKSLVMRFGSTFADRLTLLAPILAEQAAHAFEAGRTASPANPPRPTPPQPLHTSDRIRIADELGGRTLARLAFSKLTRRVRGEKH